MTIREGETAAALAEQLEKPQVTENPSAAWGSFLRTDTSGLGQFASIDSYEGIDAAALDAFVRQRLGE